MIVEALRNALEMMPADWPLATLGFWKDGRRIRRLVTGIEERSGVSSRIQTGQPVEEPYRQALLKTRVWSREPAPKVGEIVQRLGDFPQDDRVLIDAGNTVIVEVTYIERSEGCVWIWTLPKP